MKLNTSDNISQKISRTCNRSRESLTSQAPFSVVLVMDTPGHFTSQLALAKEFCKSGHRVLALISSPAAVAFLDKVAPGHDLDARPSVKIKGSTFMTQLIKRARGSGLAILSNSWQFFTLTISGEDNHLRCLTTKPVAFGRIWRELSLQKKTTLLVWPEINFFYGHLWIFRLAKRVKAHQAIYPFSLVNEKEGLLYLSKSALRTRNSLSNQILDVFFSPWTRIRNGKRVRLPLRFLILSAFVGYKTYNPWLPGANSDIPIITPDSFTFRYLADSGYEASHLFIGGMPRGDELVAQRSKHILESTNSYKRKPRVLIALPADQTFDLPGVSFRKLLEDKIFSQILPLASIADFSFALHPRLDQESKEWLLAMRLKLINEDLATSIARCDVYVACSSATLRIAESLGVPAIDYDIYSFGYEDFANSRFVQSASDGIELQDLLISLATHQQEAEIDFEVAHNPIIRITQEAKRATAFYPKVLCSSKRALP